MNRGMIDEPADRQDADAGQANDDVSTLRDAARWLRAVAEKCCECTDGHHDQMGAYGTEDDVHISRDTARALAEWLAADADAIERHGLDVTISMAYVVAGGLMTGSTEPRNTPGASGTAKRPGGAA